MRRNSALFPHRIHNHPALPGRRDEAGAWFERCDAQAPGDEAARQLAASTPDLKHMITAPDPRDLTSLVDEFVGISRTPAVVTRPGPHQRPCRTDGQQILAARSLSPPFTLVTVLAASWWSSAGY